MTDALQASYDEIPYTNSFFTASHPDRMAAMATLFGLAPAHPGRCRVLELGCANGGNLLPMAQMLPGSEFVGIDLSPKQVATGREIVAALGLGNVTLRALSILDVDASFGRFDYIICHGVYSWVPEPVRDKILEICATHLNPEGVAYISYNTYPGWHFRGMVREMLDYHVRPFPDPRVRVRQARAFLDFLVQTSIDRDTSFARAVQDEAKLLDKESDTYLLHEHLDEVNHPVYFHEFVALAARAGLQYLAPARFSTLDAHLPPLVREVLNKMAGDRVRREQYLDFVRNRPFRSSLLCHADRAVRSSPSNEALTTLRLSALARPTEPDPDVRSDAVVKFANRTGDDLSSNRPLVKASLVELYEVWPRSLTFDELRSRVEDRLGVSTADVTSDLAETLSQCHQANMVALQVDDPRFASEVGDRPAVTPLARLQAEADQGIINARLLTVELEDFDRLVVQLLDGTRDRAALLTDLAGLAAEGTFEIEHDGHPVRDVETARAVLAGWLDTTLDRIALNALLVETP